MPDVYVYDSLPKKFRIQIIHIANKYINDEYDCWYYKFVEILKEERGVFNLVPSYERRLGEEFFDYFIYEQNVNYALDCVELIGKGIYGKHEYDSNRDSYISEINTRFKENGVGYQFENNQIIRVDSQYIHSEVIKPVIEILSDGKYKGANEEFRKAHDYYRHGDNKACLVECLKSLESTIKTIILARNHQYNQKDNISKLIDIIFEKKIVPQYLQSHFNSLRSTLVSGAPTIRNKLGGHGQGEELKEVPDYMAAYALHLTAAGILFLHNAAQDPLSRLREREGPGQRPGG